ncbi:hypothetical protein B0H10DRAFT_1643768, partial [Mycena sp. CBHHK59/15]
ETESVASLRSRLSEIDAAIAQQHLLLDDLEEKRWTIEQQINSRANFPFLRLPVEIISEIFVHCLPDPSDSQPDLRKALFVLMDVCSAWRKIALSTPVLW